MGTCELNGETFAPRHLVSHVSDVTAQTQTSESALPQETRAQIDKLASRAAKELRKYRKPPAGWKLLVMDFPFVESGKITELGIFLADEFSDSLAREAEGFAVVNRRHILQILMGEKFPRESLRNKDVGEYVAEKVGADETLSGFLVMGSDGRLILSVRVFGPVRIEETLITTGAMRDLLAKEVRSPEGETEGIEPEPGVLLAGKNGVSNPSCIYCPTPEYTNPARAAKYVGTVRLSIVVTADGQVTAIKVLQGAPFGLTKQFETAIRTWKLRPAEKDGKPVAVRVSAETTYKLL